MNQPPPPYPGDSTKDEEHLNLLAIFHFIFTGLAVLGIGFLFLHYLIMSTMMNDPKAWQGAKMPPGFTPREFFAIFQWFYVFMFIILIVGGLLNVLSGYYLRARTHRTFSLIVAGLNCTQVPFGTALGIFTFIVLLRDSVRALYAAPSE